MVPTLGPKSNRYWAKSGTRPMALDPSSGRSVDQIWPTLFNQICSPLFLIKLGINFADGTPGAGCPRALPLGLPRTDAMQSRIRAHQLERAGARTNSPARCVSHVEGVHPNPEEPPPCGSQPGT